LGGRKKNFENEKLKIAIENKNMLDSLNYRYELQIKLMLQKMEEEKKKIQLDMSKQLEESKNMYHRSRLSKMDVDDLKKLQQTTQNNLNLIVDLIVQRSFTNDTNQKKKFVLFVWKMKPLLH